MVIDTPIIVYSVLGLLLFIAVMLLRLEIKMKRFLVGKNTKNIIDTLVFLRDEISDEHVFRKEVQEYLTSVEKRLRKSVQYIETVRFNPFKGTGSGGNQSFATTMLSERGNGVVISSLYSRDRTSVFSKPITSFESDYELSEEERHVITTVKKAAMKERLVEPSEHHDSEK